MATEQEIQKAVQQREQALHRFYTQEISYKEYQQANLKFLQTLGCNH